jgi:hypothetical protein
MLDHSINAFDALEVHRVFEWPDPSEEGKTICEQADDGKPDETVIKVFWTLYGHSQGHGTYAIMDFDTEKEAWLMFALLNGLRYTPQQWDLYRKARTDSVSWDLLAESLYARRAGRGFNGFWHIGFRRPFGPDKFASERCASGKRDYCTCDTCF